MQECKDHMAMAKGSMKKDEPTTRKDAACADMMKKDGMMKPMTMQECKDHIAMAKGSMKKDEPTTQKDVACADMMKK